MDDLVKNVGFYSQIIFLSIFKPILPRFILMKLFLILGNQLFNPAYFNKYKDHIFFMAEDFDLCTFEKHHKLKILLFLSSMRSYAENLKKNNFKINYSKIDNSDSKVDYIAKIQKILNI